MKLNSYLKKLQFQLKYYFIYLLIIFFIIFFTSICRAQSKTPYLLYVSFYTPRYNKLTLKNIQILNNSPYNGIAATLIGAYSDRQINLYEYEDSTFLIKRYTKKHVWPWIFLNRIVGYDPIYSKKRSYVSKKQYFRDIIGMDIFDTTGALSDFFNIWKVALNLAKQTGVPGIVVDLEAYNNYKAYRIDYLSHCMHIPKSIIILTLEEIGKHLANITNQIYPDAVIWCLFTGLISRTHNWEIFPSTCYMSVTYIVKGMLEQAKFAGYKFKVVTGGEVSLGYCFKSLNDLKQKITIRKKKYSPILVRYPNLHLGGTIAPWADIQSKTGWLLKGRCGCSEVKNINEFLPLFSLLFKTYKYVWIYGAGAAHYNLFEKSKNFFNQAIKKALEENNY